MPPSSPAQSTPSGTSDPAPIEFNIPAQSLTSALNQFAKTSGLQVSYPAELTKGLSSSPVTGSYQPEAALGLLLGGTGLTYRFTDAATVTLAQDAPISVVPSPRRHWARQRMRRTRQNTGNRRERVAATARA